MVTADASALTPASFHPPAIVLVALVALVLWRLYARSRRLIGRQELRSAVRPWATVTAFSLIVLTLCPGALRTHEGLAALMGGLGAGLLLGSYGLKLTRFEPGPQGHFYTPHAHIGIALSLLLAGRVLFKLGSLWSAGFPTGAPPQDFVSSPLTLAILCVLAGYYVTYAIGLLRWHRTLGRQRKAIGS